MNIRLLFLSQLVFALTIAGCGLEVSEGWQEQLASCPTRAELEKFKPGDVLTISVFEEENLSGKYEVSQEGELKFPKLGVLSVEGLDCREMEVLLEEGLETDFLREASVNCSLEYDKRDLVTVDGLVKKPGILEFWEGMMLTDAIAGSGGLERTAGQVAVIHRREDKKTKSVIVPFRDILEAREKNVCIAPGDFIFVPERSL